MKYKKVKPIKGFVVVSHHGDVDLKSFRSTKKAVKECLLWPLKITKAKIVPASVHVKIGK